jgi:hypothetical protein
VRSINKAGPGSPPTDLPVEGDFRGQAVIVDTLTGTVASYKAFNNPTSENEGTWNNVVVSHPSYDLTWYPTVGSPALGAAGVNTIWFAIVTGGSDTAGQGFPTTDPGLANSAGWQGSVTLKNGWTAGVFDRDENPRSGGLTPTVTCEGFLTLDNMLSSAQLSATANGGYSWEVVTPNCDGGAGAAGSAACGTTPVSATGILMTKIEITTALGRPFITLSQENAFPNIPY